MRYLIFIWMLIITFFVLMVVKLAKSIYMIGCDANALLSRKEEIYPTDKL